MRWATTAKPAAATSEASSTKTVATENIASVSSARWFGPVSDPANVDSPRSPSDSTNDPIDRSPAATRTVT